MHAALIRFMSIPPVLLMKYAKNNIHSRFYIFIILKTGFFRKGGFHKVWCSLFVENRHRHVVLFVQNRKKDAQCAPTVKKILCRSPLSERSPLSDFRQTKK